MFHSGIWGGLVAMMSRRQLRRIVPAHTKDDMVLTCPVVSPLGIREGERSSRESYLSRLGPSESATLSALRKPLCLAALCVRPFCALYWQGFERPATCCGAFTSSWRSFALTDTSHRQLCREWINVCSSTLCVHPPRTSLPLWSLLSPNPLLHLPLFISCFFVVLFPFPLALQSLSFLSLPSRGGEAVRGWGNWHGVGG